MGHVEILDYSTRRQYVLKQVSQRGKIPLAVAQVVEELVLRFLRCDLERLVEGAIRREGMPVEL